jgi:hypothetical protein
MTEQIPSKAIERFENLQRLYNNQGSAPGERDNAKRLMDKLRAQYPNIDFYVRGDDPQPFTQPQPNPYPESRDWHDRYREQQQDSRFNWREWMGWAAGFADKAFGIREAQMIGEMTPVTFRRNAKGSLSISAKLDPDLMRRIDHAFSEEQKVLLCNALAQKIAQELLRKLTED